MNVIRVFRVLFALLALGVCGGALPAAELRVHAFTAYTLPQPEGARISQRSGITRWSDPALSVNWYGQFKQTGHISVKLVVRLPAGAESKLRLTVAGQTREVSVNGAGDSAAVADFGKFKIAKAGYRALPSNR